MFITVKHTVRQYAVGDEEAKKLLDLGVKPAVVEVRMYATFRAQDVLFVDEVQPLNESKIQSKIIVTFGNGYREFMLECTHDEAAQLVKDAIGERTLN